MNLSLLQREIVIKIGSFLEDNYIIRKDNRLCKYFKLRLLRSIDIHANIFHYFLIISKIKTSFIISKYTDPIIIEYIKSNPRILNFDYGYEEYLNKIKINKFVDVITNSDYIYNKNKIDIFYQYKKYNKKDKNNIRSYLYFNNYTRSPIIDKCNKLYFNNTEYVINTIKFINLNFDKFVKFYINNKFENYVINDTIKITFYDSEYELDSDYE